MDPVILCVGRQLGSGGSRVAQLLASEFGCTFYDRELLNLAAKESGFSEHFFEQNDEQKGFLKSLFHMHAPHVGDNNFYASNFSQESLFQIQSDVMRKVARQGSCVFVGRCADYVLRDFPRVVSLFVTARQQDRVAAVAARRNCTSAEALKLIESTESTRASYYNYYTGKKWGHASSYDLCISSSPLGVEGAARVAAAFVREWLGR